MSNDIEKELQYIRENINGEMENSQFISNMLIEELESQKLENRRKLSFLSYNVGQVYYAPKNLIFESNESKNEIEVKTYYALNKILLGILLTGTVSVFGFKTGIDFYNIGSSIGTEIYNGVSYIFNAIGEKFSFDYVNDLKKISSKIINDILPNVSEEIKSLKGFINSEKHIIETITNGMIGLFGIYATARTEEVNIVKELLKNNNKINNQRNYNDRKYLENGMIFFAEYLYRFNVMYDLFIKKLEEMKISKDNFFYSFAQKIFSNKDLYKEITINSIYKRKRSTDSMTSDIFFDDTFEDEKYFKYIKNESKFRSLYKSFQNYIIGIEELKKYKYKEKIKLFKKVIEKTKKEQESQIINSILNDSLRNLSSQNLARLIKNYEENENKKNHPKYIKDKNKILEKIKLEKNIISESIKNIIKISKINYYCSQSENSTHFFEHSEIAKLIIEKIKNKESLFFLRIGSSGEVKDFLEKKIKEEINNKEDENLINKEINKKEEIKIKIGNKYNSPSYVDFLYYTNISENFNTNSIEILNEEIKFVKEKFKKSKDIIGKNIVNENYGFDNYEKNEFNNDINSNIHSLLRIIIDYDNRNNTEENKNFIKKYININFTKLYNLNNIKNFQIDYLNNLLKLSIKDKNIQIENLNIEEKKIIIIDFLEKSIKELINSIEDSKIKHIDFNYKNKIELNIKKSIIELIINENYDRVFKVGINKNIQHNNIPKVELLKTFFDLLLFNERTRYNNNPFMSFYQKKYKIENAYNCILEKFKYIDKEDLYLYFDDIKNIEDENIDKYYNILCSNKLIKALINEKISNFKESICEVESYIKTYDYIIRKLKNNDFALFDDRNNDLGNLYSKKDEEKRDKQDLENHNMFKEELIVEYFKMEKNNIDLFEEEIYSKNIDKNIVDFLSEKSIVVDNPNIIKRLFRKFKSK